MPAERLIVIGGVAAGLSAASQARRVDPRLEIWVYERGPDISYSACGLPYLLSGRAGSADALRVYSPEFFHARRNIRVLPNHEVTEVSTGRRRLSVIPPGGGLEDVHYDRLVLATGAEPARPEAPGANLAGIFHVNDLASTLRLKQFLETERPRAAVVAGGGYIGLEMADALVARGLSVTLVDRSATLFESVDEEIVAPIERELSKHNVRALKNSPVAAFLGDRQGRVRKVAIGHETLETDCVVLATGVRPRAKLAAEAGIETGFVGAIAVNEYLETSAPAVWAAGDCAEALHGVSGRSVYIPLGTTANKQGRVAGANAAGRRERFPGIVGTAVTQVFSLEVARTGLSLAEARAAGFTPATTYTRTFSHARYLGGKEVFVKLIADRSSGRLLGAQMAGEEGVGKRIDILATALHARMTVEQIAWLDLSYAPPFSTVWDPVLMAAQEMLRELKR